MEEFPLDIYKRNADRINANSRKKYPNGASRAVDIAANAVIEGYGGIGLARRHKKAKSDIEMLKSHGERGRSELLRQQYMQEDFIPAVEVIVNATSPDEVLNDKKVLSELDKYALLAGDGKGYTASYIRQAYGNQLGDKTSRTDPSIRSDIIRIHELLDNGEVRTAYSIADRIKKKVDDGDITADEIDYDLIGRIVSFYG